jgi:cysteine-rich repeat protein
MKNWCVLLGLSLICFACGPDPECTSPADCDDGQECTADFCDEGVCVNNNDDALVPANQISPLDCKKTVCRAGLAVILADDTETPTDNVPCTLDSCSGGSPVFIPNDNSCGNPPDCKALVCDPTGSQGIPDLEGCSAIIDDNNIPDDNADCTTDICLNGIPVNAPDNSICFGASGFAASCVVEACDPANQNTNDGSGCAVNFDDTICDDGNFCTSDTCDPSDNNSDLITGCGSSPLSNAIQIVGNCLQEVCSNGDPSEVPNPTDIPTVDSDGFSCTVVGCSSQGQITETPAAALCNDQLSCTQDLCIPSAANADVNGCVGNPINSQCSAGEACNPEEDPNTNPTGCVAADTCPPTLAVVLNGDVSGDTTSLVDDFSLSCADNTGAHPDVVFSLDLATDSDVLIQAQSQDGHALSLGLIDLSGGACGAELLCQAGDPIIVELFVVNLAAGSYGLVVDGDGATRSAGSFTLTVLQDNTTLSAGDLVINEFHADPSAVGDAVGEFLEIANPNHFIIGAAGLTLSENGGTSNQAVAGPNGEQLFIPALGFLVGVRSVDPLVNGGINADFQLSLSLNNTPNEVFRLAKASLVLDDVNSATIAFPAATAGRSFQVDRAKTSAALNDLLGAWCKTATNTTYGAGDHGTPGLQNQLCSPPSLVCLSSNDCNDQNPCTDDLCNNNICSNPINNALSPPDDGFACTFESCSSGAVVITQEDILCDNSAVACVVERCDPINENTNDGSGCSIVLNNASCADGNFCTDDICDPVIGCANPIFTGTPPPIIGNCQQELCQNGNPSQVPDPTDTPITDGDGVFCTVPECNAQGQVTETPSDALCDDGLFCTLEFCDPQFDCNVLADSSQCNAGQSCDPNQDPAQNLSGCINADTCPPTSSINSGQSIDSSTVGLLSDFSLSCANNGAAHPDLAFGFTLTQDSDVLISASPKDGQAIAIALLPISNGACGVELLCSAASASIDADLAITNLGIGNYAVIVDGNGSSLQEGDFTLTLASAPTVITAGDLLLNEIMANPPGTTVDTGGEYVELANPSLDTAVGTSGLTITDGTTTVNTIAGLGGAQLFIPPGGFLVGVHDLNAANNGGINNGKFAISFALNNTPGDIFKISKGTNVIDAVNTTAANPNGAFPSAVDGVSFQLDPPKKTATLNDNKTSWCSTPSAIYGNLGGKGSPGLENQFCTAPQCTVATQATDCNDNNVCTNDTCVTGVCQHPINNAATPADDGFSCTVESCSGGAALHTPDNFACDDSILCTDDLCVGTGGSAGTGCKNTANDNNCNAAEFCDPVIDCQPLGFCGDGSIDSGEQCDDDNFAGGDGCDGNCVIEFGFSCVGAPSVCALTCGDSVINPGEQCDGANLNGQNCISRGFDAGTLTCNANCTFNTLGCSLNCGNGVLDAGESCDDFNNNNGDGCSSLCSVELGFSCSGQPSVCVSTCGNGTINVGEECDDNNTISSDGCSNLCTIETLFFSEYVEGSGSSKAVEIKNPLSTAFNLTANVCQVRIFANGGTTASATIALTGTINPNSTFVLCNPSGTIPSAQCNQSSGSLNFNGNDAVELRCTVPSVVTFDVIGQIGFDPGSEWGTGNRSTADNTIRRKCNRTISGLFITHGDTSSNNDFNADLIDEWAGFVNNTFDGLGVSSCEP